MSTFLINGHLKEDTIEVIASSASPLYLTSYTPSIIHIQGTDTQLIVLPRATTLETGIHFTIVNDSTGLVTIKDFAATDLAFLTNGFSANLYLSNNSTSAGVWAKIVAAGGGGNVTVITSATIARGYPVSITALGELAICDITDEDSAYAFCGVTSIDCLISGIDTVLTSGSVLIDIPAVFGLTGQYGKHIFVSHTGGLTAIKPEIGIGGFVSQDFIVSVGVTTKNTATSTTDLILNPRIIGRLA